MKFWFYIIICIVGLGVSQSMAIDVSIGGRIVFENEYHQEPDGTKLWLSEINSAQFILEAESDDGKLHVIMEPNFLPEEIIHQLDEIKLKDGRMLDTTGFVETITETDEAGHGGEEGTVPFERAMVTYHFDRAFTFSFGQVRNPFGIWGEFTSHRNFSLTKNNAMVLGTALKKFEIGGIASGSVSDFEYRVGFLNGNHLRTSDLGRADDNNRKDAVGRFGWRKNGFKLGFNSYLVDMKTDKYAVGADFLVPINRFAFSGEIIRQKNSIDELESTAGYLQTKITLHDMLEGLMGYVLLDVWSLDVDGVNVVDGANKQFIGLKYQFIPGMILTGEYGRIANRGFDDGEFHSSIQLELVF